MQLMRLVLRAKVWSHGRDSNPRYFLLTREVQSSLMPPWPLWSARRASNPQLRPWKGRTLPIELLTRQDGGSGRNRTANIMLAKHTLYRLSYAPVEEIEWGEEREEVRLLHPKKGGTSWVSVKPAKLVSVRGIRRVWSCLVFADRCNPTASRSKSKSNLFLVDVCRTSNGRDWRRGRDLNPRTAFTVF